MDRITRSLLESFVLEHELDALDQSKQFEHFINYVIVSKLHRNSFELEDLETGGGGDSAIDGIAIFVNGKLVTDIDEVYDLSEDAGYLDCDIVFVQSKTSSKFEGSEILSFIYGVKDFISEEPKLAHNEELSKFKLIWETIISKSSFMINRLPVCRLYYATTGKWLDDVNLKAVIESGITEINDSRLFYNATFMPYGASEIQRLYHETRNKLSTTINFLSRITLPDIEKIKEAYLGILPYVEFKKLIEDENENLYNIFYDNIRDFQGDNPVNSKIRITLEQKKFELFCLLNNGVTVVATSLTPAGNKFTLRDYQIVNGCQTSHVLHAARNIEGIENINVPVKVIVTEDEDISNEIILATNSQTEVRPEQLEALTQFQKSLERYYDSIKGVGRLYYERRSKQYHATSGIKKTQIISIPIQIKSFASQFLNVPHAVSGYYGTIVKRFSGRLFDHDHKYSPYYASALAYYKLEGLFRGGVIDSKYKKAKFHLLMLARMLAMGIDLPQLNSRSIEQSCETYIKQLNDDGKCLILFNKATSIFDKSGLNIEQKQFKAESETDLLMDTLRNA